MTQGNVSKAGRKISGRPEAGPNFRRRGRRLTVAGLALGLFGAFAWPSGVGVAQTHADLTAARSAISEGAYRTALDHLTKAIEAGDLPVYHVGGWPRVRWLEVLAWVESKRRPVGEPASDSLQRRVADQ